MIDLALSPEDEQTRNQIMKQQSAPLAQAQAPQQKSTFMGDLGNMAKQRAQEGILNAGQKGITSALTSSSAPVVGSAIEGGSVLGAGAGSGAMASIGTAMPYVGAGLLAGKALGFFNEGGTVGPLSTQYAADGDKIDRNKQYTEDQQMNNYKEMIRQQMYNKSIMGQNPTRGINKADAARAAFTTDPILSKMYGVGKAPSDSGMYDLSVFQGLFPIDDKGYTARGYDQGGQVSMNDNDEINKILDEIEAESMVEGAMGVSQQMPMPMMRPPLGIAPLNADTTYSPYDMIRPDNAPNT